MLKFQDNHTTVIATFEDFILTIYVIIDELYRCFAPPEVTQRRQIQNAKLSDPEIITIGICGELTSVDSENAWYSFVKKTTAIFFRTFAAGAVFIGRGALCSKQQNYCVKRYLVFSRFPATAILWWTVSRSLFVNLEEHATAVLSVNPVPIMENAPRKKKHILVIKCMR